MCDQKMEGDIVVIDEGGVDELKDLPPGFRFHPTDEEIITYYLKQKVINNQFTSQAIGEVDLNKCEPWDLPKKAKMGEKEYFFFCQRDRKYPTGMRTNRATELGYWKATGKDREIFKGKGNKLVGMKKTLVFYKGRAPKGEKTNWIMHEYRLDGTFSYHCMPKSKEEWVVSKIFHKMAGKGNPIGELIRVDSFVNHLLNNPSLPGLMEINNDEAANYYSDFSNIEEEIKDPNENLSFSLSSQIQKMAQYQHSNNINYHQASSSNIISTPNPVFSYPQDTYQNLEFAYQNQKIRHGNFSGFLNPGPGSSNQEIRPGNFPGLFKHPGSGSWNHRTLFSKPAIMKDCKVERFSTNNNSMVSHSQDTGLSADFGPPEISSMVSKPGNNFGPEKAFEGGLEFLCSDPIIAQSDSFWDY